MQKVMTVSDTSTDVSAVDLYRRQYQEHGFFIIPGCLPQIELQALKAEVQRIHNCWLQMNREDYQKYAMINMHGLTDPVYFQGTDGKSDAKRRGEFFNLLAPLSLLTTMASVFGNDLYFHNTQLFFNPYRNGRTPYWHRDMQYQGESEAIQKADLASMLSLHVRIPLIDEKGIELIPGTHKRWDNEREHQVRLELNGHENHQSLPESQLISLNAGDALVFSAHMIHRGHYCLPKRLALDLCVGSPHPKPLKYLDSKHLPNVSELPYIEHPQWFNRAINHIHEHGGN
ncbi:phytanoyl-CoA dioxygenase family protein [Thalassotalea mangrovi]|uniref:Phytanoyl-CoA dioxygenase family protein n=1 Tax=Thalassotalea mangrovi TaxID=2572245 RepID=A0A4U1B5I9_9GAMM|nr:phytanoyl-CoA dioxygenase family protein [Thalassotalea mangrovi]TKB45621.1 phytanoyl-CoA dioxygenase family protein [Thalassotalea mangrovi]